MFRSSFAFSHSRRSAVAAAPAAYSSLTRLLSSSSSNSSSSQPTIPTLHTALYDAHVKLQGKLVPFAGYSLPVQYPDGVLKNHLHVRESAGLFDVSHMGQLRIVGADRIEFIERITVADMAALEEHQSTLSMITTKEGTIIDDTVITKRADHIFMVVNGACKAKDLAHMRAQIQQSGLDLNIEFLEDRSLMALQGPRSVAVMSRLVPSDVDFSSWAFMTDRDIQVAGFDCTVNRCGYTGEDGFEISVADSDAVSLWERILQEDEVRASGLATRDSLRLEAGLCLYGNDIDETTTPIEAALNWTISKRRRQKGGFLGEEVILGQLQSPKTCRRKRVGLTITKGAPARDGTEVYAADGETVVGHVTSGTMSPSLKKPISMAYIDKPHNKIGTELKIKVRNRFSDAVVTKMPWVTAKYHRI